MTNEKVTKIIEYQDDRQRTPKEILEFLLDQADDIERIAVNYVTKNDGQFYMPGSKERNYSQAHLLWDFDEAHSLYVTAAHAEPIKKEDLWIWLK